MAWLPTVKAILPYLTQIVTTAIPVLTKKTDKGEAEKIIPNQISELQEAATLNAESLKILASQFQQFISDIDTGSVKIEKEIKAVKRLSIIAIVISVIAIILSIASWLH